MCYPHWLAGEFTHVDDEPIVWHHSRTGRVPRIRGILQCKACSADENLLRVRVGKLGQSSGETWSTGLQDGQSLMRRM
ncbi:MAG: hypothetical protein NAOJABEB_01195 [Steroidobacteraceae bacterium]|nr:hypothetical protein [Steroidobacteraceae bacterium]